MEEKVDAHNYFCVEAVKSRTHVAGDYEQHKEKRGVIEGALWTPNDGSTK